MRATLRAFIRLSRLKFLTGGVLGFALGAAVARADGAELTWPAYLHGQIMVSAFHLMVHYANDYYDRFCDAASERTPWSGGSGALVEGTLPASAALVAALACAAVGIAAAAAFATTGNWLAAFAGMFAGSLAWTYSAPPCRLQARGLGEIDTALIIGVLFPVCGYVTFGSAPSARMLASTLPAAAAVFVLMFSVEYPDVEADRAAGKLNLVARLGRARGRALVYGAIALLYAGSVVAVAFGATPALLAFVALTIPLAWSLCRQLAAGEPLGIANADVAAKGVALYVCTIFGSLVAYLV